MSKKEEYCDLAVLDPQAFKKSNILKNTFLFKRLFDVTVSFLFILVLFPIMLLLGFLIVQESPCKAIFSQWRVGLNGVPYKMLKFRSMHETRVDDLVNFAEVDDKRITRIGRFIRRHRIDEWPQLFNVLKGEMSLIGPRPEQVKIFEELVNLIPTYSLRVLVRPGITGWAQVNIGYTDDLQGANKKVAYDLYYISNHSLVLDLKIVLRTVAVIFGGFGAR